MNRPLLTLTQPTKFTDSELRLIGNRHLECKVLPWRRVESSRVVEIRPAVVPMEAA